ncbi:MAG: small ribosomal subunit biogenesis GTPase RsgA [Cyanobacteria bacterium P01_H01_bin.15]
MIESDSIRGQVTLWGTVVAVQANFYQVRLDNGIVTITHLSPELWLCTRRARLKKIGQQVMVGDRVRIEEPDWQNRRGAIAEVAERQSQMERPPIVNVDQVLLVFALAEPTLDPWQLSRFLVKAETVGLPLTLVLNKQDLMCATEIDAWRSRLQGWGYSPLFVSVDEAQGLEAVRDCLVDRITVLAGPSGVGKSSLIRRLLPHLESVRVGRVSGKLGRGRHTTRHVELFELPDGGFLADSPGFNQPDLNCAPEVLIDCFPERPTAPCEYADCWHQDEPNCGVRGGWERYAHYLQFLDVVIAAQTTRQDRPDEEASLKLKMGTSGTKEYEPKLATKKYRRTSRRRKHQDWQSWENQSLEELTAELDID